ncbi:hypothetical protein MITSMUL_03700 [Mitsuokella multacida DSM 20544]|uniref:Uncharacterized protein n=1 Tax=Mitsuokella multacida DSM 20544 TaxID=500635 RepID=C9KKK2_9FIRM|nr:hypothetical protein MITSMUL_03700 [Mitsuokella multacida DSM 20544]
MCLTCHKFSRIQENLPECRKKYRKGMSSATVHFPDSYHI